jgi:hypothetical protein
VKKVGMQIFSTASSRSRQRKILHCHSRHFLSGIHLVFSQSTSIDRMERGTCVYPKHHVHQILCDAGFRPGGRSIAWGVPKGATFVLEAKVDKNNDAQSGLIRCVGRRLRRADQLAALRQGLPIDKSVRPNGRTAGVER